MRNESGRSLLELIMVIAIIGLLTLGALAGYRQVINRHEATSLYEDIMVQADSMRGNNFKGKSIYNSGLGYKTRLGLPLSSATNSDNTFSVQVKSVSSELCEYLKKMDWKDALRISVNNVTKTPSEMDCSTSGEKFTLTISFPLRVSMPEGQYDPYEPCSGRCMACQSCDEDSDTCVDTCGSGKHCVNDICENVAIPTPDDPSEMCEGGCMDCERCNTESNTCVDTCGLGKRCIDNVCENINICSEGERYLRGLNTCAACIPEKPCETCPSTTPNWDGTNCVCYSTSCGRTAYCGSDRACHPCPENASCITGSIQCDSGEDMICPTNHSNEFGCVCVAPNGNGACNSNYCIACPAGQEAKCPTSSGACVCVASDGNGACNSNKCISCPAGQEAKCPSSSGACVCVSATNNYLCSKTNCALCDKDTETPRCPSGGSGTCVCTKNETENSRCNNSTCISCPKDQYVMCTQNASNRTECRCTEKPLHESCAYIGCGTVPSKYCYLVAEDETFTCGSTCPGHADSCVACKTGQKVRCYSAIGTDCRCVND